MLQSPEDGEGDQPSVLRWRLLQLRVRIGYVVSCRRGARAVVEGDEFTRDPPNMIFLSEGHVRRVCREFVEYYNRARPSQAIGAIPNPYPELQISPLSEGKLVALPVLGGLEHDYRLAA